MTKWSPLQGSVGETQPHQCLEFRLGFQERGRASPQKSSTAPPSLGLRPHHRVTVSRRGANLSSLLPSCKVMARLNEEEVERQRHILSGLLMWFSARLLSQFFCLSINCHVCFGVGSHAGYRSSPQGPAPAQISVTVLPAQQSCHPSKQHSSLLDFLLMPQHWLVSAFPFWDKNDPEPSRRHAQS